MESGQTGERAESRGNEKQWGMWSEREESRTARGFWVRGPEEAVSGVKAETD